MRQALFLLVLSAACVTAQPTDDAVKQELKNFQGKWTAVYAQDVNGKALPDATIKEMTLEVDGNKFVIKSPDSKLDGTFKIDPTKKPKTIDIYFDETKVPFALGIYEHIGDTRKSCFSQRADKRPDTFRKEAGYVYLEWQRVK